MTKIKKLFMEDFGVFRGKHEIEFATDEKNRITLLVGSNGRGKTTILNALRSGFGCNMILPQRFSDDYTQRDYYKDAKSSVEIDGQKLEIHPNEEFLYFLDDEMIHSRNIWQSRNFSLDQTVIDEMNKLLKYSNLLSRESSGFRLVNSEIQLLHKSGYNMIWGNASMDAAFVNLITLIALQKKHNISFFVLDDIFGRLDNQHSNELCQLLLRECKQQLILLVPDTVIQLLFSWALVFQLMDIQQFNNGLTIEEAVASLRDDPTNTASIGSAYQLIRKEGTSSIEPLEARKVSSANGPGDLGLEYTQQFEEALIFLAQRIARRTQE